MFNSTTLEVALGLIFLYILISLLCSSIQEMISQIFKLRAKTLEAGLTNLLHSWEAGKRKQLVLEIYSHPLIKGLSKPNKRPSYIPSRNFTLALIDVMSGSKGKLLADNKSLLTALEEGNYANTEAGKSVILLVNDAGNDVVKARESLEYWYNEAMERVGGWYKRTVQYIIFVVALIVCITLNIDSIKISQELWTTPALRQAMVHASSQSMDDLMPQQIVSETITQSDETNATLVNGEINDEMLLSRIQNSANNSQVLFNQIRGLDLPIGWQDKDGKWISAEFTEMDWFLKFMGILITTFAASLGAPFWFQLLNKVTNLRSSGKQPDRISDK